MADGRKQIEGSGDAEGAAFIEVDTEVDLDLDFEEDNQPIPLSRMEGRDLRVYFPKTGEPDFGYVRQGGELRKMTEEERARQKRRGRRTSISGESVTGRQPESKSRRRSATQSTRDRSPSRQRSANRGAYAGPQSRRRSALSTPRRRSQSRRRDPPREPEQAQPRTWREAVEWRKGDKWICVVSQCRREEHTYSTYERLVDHFRTNHQRQVVVYECPLVRKGECRYTSDRRDMAVRHARRSHIYEYEDAEMVRGCENLRSTIKRNPKYRDPGQLSLPPDPSTGQLPEMILQVPDNPEAEYTPLSIREQTRARTPKVRSVARRNPPPREVESTPGAVGVLERRMSEVKASSPEPRSVEDREGAQAQEAVRLASPAEYCLPRAVRDFEGEKRSITHRLTEVRHQMEEL